MRVPLVQLNELSEVITKGTTPTTLGFDFVSEGIGFLRVQNISGGDVNFEQDTLFIDDKTHLALGRSQIKAGDVLVSIAGTIGRAGVVPENAPPLNCNQAVAIVRTNDQVHRPYLRHWLESSEAQFQMRGATVTGTISNLSLAQLGNLQIPLPPLDEQRRIAAILDKADAIRRKRQESIRLTEEFLRSTFLEMFGDPVTNPKGWEVRQFSDVGSLDRGASKHRPRNAPELLGGPYPLIQTGDVANSDGYIRSYKSTYSEIGLKQSKMWPAGTLCITIAANIAKTGILTFDACFPDSVVGFSPNAQTTTEYVQYWLGFLQKILEDTAPESAQKNINLEILRNLDIPLPPIDLQRQFSTQLTNVQEMKAKQTAGVVSVDTLFNSLTHRAFRGEL